MSQPWIDYDLPRELVAQQPLNNRADARLMVVDRHRQTIEHHHVRSLPELLRSGDRLVVNDTKVVAAQLRGVRTTTGGRWQGLYLETLADGDWLIVCKTRGKLKPPEPISLLDRDARPAAKLWLLESLGDGRYRARPEGDEPADTLLERIGRVPLPPYIRGGTMVDNDIDRYQTVYARQKGAVAAPTAGLHFTESLFKALAQAGIDVSAVTLHVGLGTFQPISTEDPAEHPMHKERYELSQIAAREIQASREAGERIIAVGTTVIRVLEAVAQQQNLAEQNKGSAPLAPSSGETDLYIRPGYEFRVVDAMLTNFHFPRTTLLLLVQAFGGSELIAEAYRQAVAEEYRFYSYGDAMLIV